MDQENVLVEAGREANGASRGPTAVETGFQILGLKDLIELGKELRLTAGSEELRTFVKEQLDRSRDERQSARAAAQERREAAAETAERERRSQETLLRLRFDHEAHLARVAAETQKTSGEPQQNSKARKIDIPVLAEPDDVDLTHFSD